MNAKNKISFAVILPVLTAIIIFGSFNNVEAETRAQAERLSPNSFGTNTNVCGDRLCSEIDNVKDEIDSNIQVIDVYPLSGNYYKILLKVEADLEPLFYNVVYVTSDTSARTLGIPFINENSHDYVTTTIKAFDPSSIEAVRSPIDAIPEDGIESPMVSLVDASNISDQDDVYRIVFDTTTQDFNAKNIKVEISSDVDSIMYTIGGLFQNNTDTNQVILKVLEPESISLQVIDYEINR